ncbi:hypothetical protein [Candidatus Liberibacter brunswickensis]|uniref:hypothetical protein n=1 Tax=Candidatus Liberibacter brunswickensis TaxID=1968796 RepID=UPI002FDF135F
MNTLIKPDLEKSFTSYANNEKINNLQFEQFLAYTRLQAEMELKRSTIQAEIDIKRQKLEAEYLLEKNLKLHHKSVLPQQNTL